MWCTFQLQKILWFVKFCYPLLSAPLCHHSPWGTETINYYTDSLSHSKCLLVNSLVWRANPRAASVWGFSFCPDTGRDVWLFRLSHVTSGSSHEKIFFKVWKSFFFLTFIYQRKTWPLIYSLSWRTRNRTSERSERVSFMIQKRVWKYCTKPFPCGIGFITYLDLNSCSTSLMTNFKAHNPPHLYVSHNE